MDSTTSAMPLHTSSFLMEKYLEAANIALDEAIANRPRPKTISKRYVLKDQHPIRNAQEKVFRTVGQWSRALHLVALGCADIFRFLARRPRPISFPAFRHRRFKARTKPVTFRIWAGSGGMGGRRGIWSATSMRPIDQPKVFEFVDHVEPHTGFSILPYGLAGASEVDKVGADKWDGPGLARAMGGNRGAAERQLAAGKPSADFRRSAASEIVDQLRRSLRSRFEGPAQRMPSGSCATLPAGHFADR